MTATNQRSLLAVGGLVALAGSLVGMRSSYQERRREGDMVRARAVVQGHLEALQQGDFERAFRFAATGFHVGMTLTDFKKLVEGNYPQIAHPHGFRLGQARWQNGAVLVD